MTGCHVDLSLCVCAFICALCFVWLCEVLNHCDRGYVTCSGTEGD